MVRETNLGVPFTFQFDITVTGTPEQLTVKIRESTIAFVESNPDTITDSGNGFLIAGFQTGDVITVSGSSSNDGTYTVQTVAAGTLTLKSGGGVSDSLTTEGAGATVKIVASKSVPEGVAVTVKAKYANGGTIRVADSSAKALNTTTGGFGLRNNESVGLQVTQTDSIWIDATVTGEGVEVIFERNTQS